jgi:hypothetical protein
MDGQLANGVPSKGIARIHAQGGLVSVCGGLMLALDARLITFFLLSSGLCAEEIGDAALGTWWCWKLDGDRDRPSVQAAGLRWCARRVERRIADRSRDH